MMACIKACDFGSAMVKDAALTVGCSVEAFVVRDHDYTIAAQADISLEHIGVEVQSEIKRC